MELVLAQSAGSHTCSYTENQGHLHGHLAATARRPQHVARKGYAGYTLDTELRLRYGELAIVTSSTLERVTAVPELQHGVRAKQPVV